MWIEFFLSAYEFRLRLRLVCTLWSLRCGTVLIINRSHPCYGLRRRNEESLPLPLSLRLNAVSGHLLASGGSWGLSITEPLTHVRDPPWDPNLRRHRFEVTTWHRVWPVLGVWSPMPLHVWGVVILVVDRSKLVHGSESVYIAIEVNSVAFTTSGRVETSITAPDCWVAPST